MSRVSIPHQTFMNQLEGLTSNSRRIVAGALFDVDANGDMCVDRQEFKAVKRAISGALEKQAQKAFTELASPAACGAGIPHQTFMNQLKGLTSYSRRIVAGTLFDVDANGDMCVDRQEFKAVKRAISGALEKQAQKAFTELAAPTCATGVQCGPRR